jgi:hypothetical protein
VLEALAAKIDRLNDRQTAGFFLACSQALWPAFQARADHVGKSSDRLLAVHQVATRFVVLGALPAPDELRALDQDFEETAPPGAGRSQGWLLTWTRSAESPG